MNSEKLRVGLAQMNSIDDVDSNLMQIEALLDEVKHENLDLICFPENSIYMRLREGEKIPGLSLQDEVFQVLRRRAMDMNTNLHLGALPLKIDGHLYNSSVLIKKDGTISDSYQKMHLFDIQLSGQNAYRESDVFRHGQGPQIIQIDGWKIGQSICYDLRFTELYNYYARKEVDLILVPAAFLIKTGEAHWHVLLRARAIESQAYVVASAQGGIHNSPRGGIRETYGNSLIVDPWGKIILALDTQPQIQTYVLAKSIIEDVRRQIPMKFHRRIFSGI